jgi:hypothetical protein
MALIPFWNWLFHWVTGVNAPNGLGYFLSFASFILIICLILMLAVAAVF